MADVTYTEPPRNDGEDIKYWRKRVLRARLDVIDGWLAEGDALSSELADVLSAIRGPDGDSDVVKSSSTTFIRKEAFPKASDAYDQNVFTMWSFHRYGDQIHLSEDNEYHFNDHIERAAKALGLGVVIDKE